MGRQETSVAAGGRTFGGRMFSVGLAVMFGVLGSASLAEDAAPVDDVPYSCSGDAGAEKCVCVTTGSCKAMLDRCKTATMTCTGPVCTCKMARKRPMPGAGAKAKAGGVVNGSAGN